MIHPRPHSLTVDLYSLGSNDRRWNHVFVGTGSLWVGDAKMTKGKDGRLKRVDRDKTQLPISLRNLGKTNTDYMNWFNSNMNPVTTVTDANQLMIDTDSSQIILYATSLLGSDILIDTIFEADDFLDITISGGEKILYVDGQRNTSATENNYVPDGSLDNPYKTITALLSIASLKQALILELVNEKTLLNSPMCGVIIVCADRDCNICINSSLFSCIIVKTTASKTKFLGC